MRILFDTSVLVAALVTSHSRHASSFTWLKRAKAGEFESCVCSHSLAELYSILTSLPVKPRVSPSDAYRLVGESVQKVFSIVALSATDYSRVLQTLAERNLPGGIIYDALLAFAARKTNADSLVTLNPKDFQRIWNEGDPRVIEP